MRVNSKQNCNINRNNSPQFRGTVSPEYVQYVNELRNDCLRVVPERRFELINKVCDDILKKSKDVMEKCFHPDSVLSINTTKSKEYDAIVASNILKKYFNGESSNVGFVAKKEQNSPIARLRALRTAMKKYMFREACCLELTHSNMLVGQLLKRKDCANNKEKFADTLTILKWWNEHLSLLEQETKADVHNPDICKKSCNRQLSILLQQTA